MNVKDSTGKVIKVNDVVKDSAGEIMRVVEGLGSFENPQLGVVNPVARYQDRLDAYPDGELTILGNLEYWKK